MHISDGGLSTVVCAAGYAITAAGIAFAVKGTKEEDIPKISLMAGTFFCHLINYDSDSAQLGTPLDVRAYRYYFGKKVAPSLFFPPCCCRPFSFSTAV